MTCSTASGASTLTTMDIDPDRILHTSGRHVFYNFTNSNHLTISNGSLYFADSSEQTTAYPGVTDTVPASSSSTGIKGQLAYDSNYIYVCVAQDTWKRIAASDF